MAQVVFKISYDGEWEYNSEGRMRYSRGRHRIERFRRDSNLVGMIQSLYHMLNINEARYSISLSSYLSNDEDAGGVLYGISDENAFGSLMQLADVSCNRMARPIVIYVTTTEREPNVDNVIPTGEDRPWESGNLDSHYPTVNLACDDGYNYQTPCVSTPYFQQENEASQDERLSYVSCEESGGAAYQEMPDSLQMNDRYNNMHQFHQSEPSYFPSSSQQNESYHDYHQFHGNQPSFVPSTSHHRDAGDVRDPLQFIPPVMRSDITATEIPEVLNDGEIHVGMLFHTKKTMHTALSLYALERKFQFRVYKSDKVRFLAHCVGVGCNWQFRATKASNDENLCWIVAKCDGMEQHTCVNEVFQTGHRQAKSRVIGHILQEKFNSAKRIYTAKDIQEDINESLNVKLSYMQAYRAREMALNLVRGSDEDSYYQLLQYSYMLEQKNPGTYTEFAIQDDSSFKYYFMAIGSCIRGFTHSIRKVIAVDGTHLKSKYRGIMFVATCLDGNNQLYPIAIGIGDSENDASWEWFMRRLYGAIGDGPEFVIISDRHASIEKAILSVFPLAKHGFCFYHIMGNVKSIYKMHPTTWNQFKMTFISAAKTYNQRDFELHLQNLWKLHSEAAKYLEEEVGIMRWARSQFEGRRYSILTTNIAESVNALMKEARACPVTHMVEFFRSTLQTWFFERKNMAEAMTTGLTTWANNLVLERKINADRMTVRPVSDMCYQVSGGGVKEGYVDLSLKECSCKVFQTDQIVCEHAIAVCAFLRTDHVSLCSHYYTREALINAYSEPVIPLGDQSNWCIPDDLRSFDLMPPSSTTRVGRRKVTRIPSRGEEVTTNPTRCGRCKQTGHNRRSCTNPLPLSE